MNGFFFNLDKNHFFQWTLFDFDRMLSLKGMLIKRFINVYSQKRSYLKVFEFIEI